MHYRKGSSGLSSEGAAGDRMLISLRVAHHTTLLQQQAQLRQLQLTNVPYNRNACGTLL